MPHPSHRLRLRRLRLLRLAAAPLLLLVPLGVLKWRADHPPLSPTPAASPAVQPQSQEHFARGIPLQTIASLPVPAFARHSMPSSGKSLFWGTVTPRPGATPLSFHFYAPFTSKLHQTEVEERCPLVLDVYAGAASSHPRRINHIQLATFFDWAPTKFTMLLTWLDPQQRTIPMLKIKSTIEDGMYGTSGLEHFVTFPHGWTHSASVSNLQFGAWRASVVTGQENTVVVGKNKLLEVQASLSPDTGELTEAQVARDYTFTLRWDAKHQRFEPHTASQMIAGGRTLIQSEYDFYQSYGKFP